ELQGTDKTAYTEQQYLCLNSLLKDLRKVYPKLLNITGHEDIAPQRKTDPVKCFELNKVIF
ncbi:N-acetylmuramoyl-L-alanine amidase, partial [Francisella tularensis]|uniref:N-acetylmuramoyl-L-alanine amidase n=1 Tax=Francisella tularensis TaxID=263 RepID=UPI0023AC718C|nr:1,6-anhydro-N-acetylmuramyl-L-alanine amidase AmpD [Francisella tularensis subsp. holarctica]